MTNSRNVFCRFFRTVVMVHKIPHARLTEWNNKRKHKALASGIYLLSILPELLLLNGTLFAAAVYWAAVVAAVVTMNVVFPYLKV